MRRARGVVSGLRFRTMTLVLVAAGVALMAGCDWTAVHFGPSNTNFNPVEPALTESSVQHLRMGLVVRVGGRDRALVAGGVVYVVEGLGSGDPPFSPRLLALDATTGNTRWSTELGTSGPDTGLQAVANGLVYVLVRPPSGSDRIVAFDAATGAFRWQVTPPAPGPTGGRIEVGQVIVDGPLAFAAATGGGGSEVSAIDRDGQVAWSAAPGGFFAVLAANAANHTVYTLSVIFTTNGPAIPVLTGFHEASGIVRTQVAAEISPFSLTPAVTTLGFSNGLVIGTQPNEHAQGGVGAFALHPESGALVWAGRTAGSTVAAITPSAVLDYNFREDLDTTARDTSTGAVLWRAKLGAPPQAVAGNLVYSLSASSADLVIRRLSDGSVVATVPVPPGSLAITPASGRVYDVAGSFLFTFAP
jgi:outer membrane protein assembly factor BamB